MSSHKETVNILSLPFVTKEEGELPNLFDVDDTVTEKQGKEYARIFMQSLERSDDALVAHMGVLDAAFHTKNTAGIHFILEVVQGLKEGLEASRKQQECEPKRKSKNTLLLSKSLLLSPHKEARAPH